MCLLQQWCICAVAKYKRSIYTQLFPPHAAFLYHRQIFTNTFNCYVYFCKMFIIDKKNIC